MNAPSLLLFNKPFQVLTQFTSTDAKATLKDWLDAPNMRAAGRLDYDSEGLVLLTDSGALQSRLADPRWKAPKTYFVQVEGAPTPQAIAQLCEGVQLNDGPTLPADVEQTEEPAWLWPRDPPIRFRLRAPTAWLRLTIREGRNRQVRRMTAAVGLPTLRLVRWAVGPWTIENLAPGESRAATESEMANFLRAQRTTHNGQRRTTSPYRRGAARASRR